MFSWTTRAGRFDVLETLANLGEFLGALGVIASLGYLAFQIRQNTKAVRSSSYHQAAEQTWNWCLTIAGDGELADILARREVGEMLTAAEELRAAKSDEAVIFGFENMLRLREQGLVDEDVWQNLIDNSMAGLGSERARELMAQRPGPLSQRLLTEIEARPHLFPPT